MPVRMFLDEINNWISRLNKADCLSQCRRTSVNWGSLKAWVEKKKKAEEERFSLFAWLSLRWNISLLLPWDSWARTGIYTSDSPDSLAYRFKMEVPHSTVLCLQLANLQILGLLILHNHTSQFYIIIPPFFFSLWNINKYIYNIQIIHIYFFACFSGEPRWVQNSDKYIFYINKQ